MADLSALIERVEALTGPDRSLDCEIAWHTGWDKTGRVGGMWRNAYPQWRGDDWRAKEAANNWGVPVYTASLDAAVALVERVLPGWSGDADIGKPITDSGKVGARLFPPEPGCINYAGEGPTPAIALVLATLRALQAKGGE